MEYGSRIQFGYIIKLMTSEFQSDEEDNVVAKKQKFDSYNCPYLDTIERGILDFDFEKLCSVTLSHLNVYACLVCGKYFQGRGTGTPAFIHSNEVGHRVFLNLKSLKCYCLPDNYQVIDPSLEDIKYVLNPTFTKSHIDELDSSDRLSRTKSNLTYYPGMVGLNNIKANDYSNVVLQALAGVSNLRDYFLDPSNYENLQRPLGDTLSILPKRFGELIRKLWNPRNFKNHVSPHEMLQAIVLCSKKQFQITKQGDAIEVLVWFLNSLHQSLNGTKKHKSSIVSKCFRGYMLVCSKKLISTEVPAEERLKLYELPEYEEKIEQVPFMYLTLDVPPMPLYRDELEQNVIPQVPLATLLQKFNGQQEKEYKTYKDSVVKRFLLTYLPKYLIIYIKRFHKNTFFVEKNKTIVNFSIKSLDMSEFLSQDPEVQKNNPNRVYDLLANVVHEGEPSANEEKRGSYRIHKLHKGTGKWFEIQDLHVSEILPQIITLSQAYIQIYERRDK